VSPHRGRLPWPISKIFRAFIRQTIVHQCFKFDVIRLTGYGVIAEKLRVGQLGRIFRAPCRKKYALDRKNEWHLFDGLETFSGKLKLSVHLHRTLLPQSRARTRVFATKTAQVSHTCASVYSVHLVFDRFKCAATFQHVTKSILTNASAHRIEIGRRTAVLDVRHFENGYISIEILRSIFKMVDVRHLEFPKVAN